MIGRTFRILKLVQRYIYSSVILQDQMKKMIISSIANCARFYALPKTHKSTVVSHPIISNISTVS